MKRESRILCDNATRDIILALIELAKTNDPSIYYKPSSILKKIPKRKKGYGLVLSKDMDEFLEPYISEGLVRRVLIGEMCGKILNRVYSVNPTRIGELEEKVKALR